MAWKKPQIYVNLLNTAAMASKARNFETAQHIDKQLSYVSSRINALENGTKLGATPRVFLQPRENVAKL